MVTKVAQMASQVVVIHFGNYNLDKSLEGNLFTDDFGNNINVFSVFLALIILDGFNRSVMNFDMLHMNWFIDDIGFHINVFSNFELFSMS